MDFRELNYVMTITEEQSFSRAAQKLFISQPSLSQYIKRLEESLGFDLFRRSTVPLTLTDEGKQYVEYARKILMLREEMLRGIEDIASSRRGKLVLGTSMARGAALLPALIPYFQERYPDIEITLYEKPAGESVSLEKLLAEGKIDLCLLSPPISRKDIVCETVHIERILLAAPPHFKPQRRPTHARRGRYPTIDLTELTDAPFILSAQHTRLRGEGESICREAGFIPTVPFETNSLETAQKMVAVGAGFTFVPEMCILETGAPHCPRYYIFREPEHTWPLLIAHKADGYMSRATRVFLNEIKAFFHAYRAAREQAI